MGTIYKHLGGKKIKKEHVGGGKRKEKIGVVALPT